MQFVRKRTKPVRVHSYTDDDERGHWKRPLEFLLSSVGYAVGMGSLYRFPYLAMRNGGGAFLIPYLLIMVVCGTPLFFMECALGQYTQKSPLQVFDICPLFKGIGVSMCLLSVLVTIYYMTVIAWALYFLAMTFSTTLPWTTCGNSWNTNSCIPLILDPNNSISNFTGNMSANVSEDMGILAAEEFWENNVLRLSSGIDEIGPITWPLALTLVIGWFAVFICICKGIASSRRAVYLTATLPFVIILILLCWSVTLPGATDGILVYIVPRWEKMAHFQVWLEAFITVFYSLGPAWGGVITLASYNPFKHNCARDAVIVTLIDALTAILCGFIIFSGLGYMAQQRGVPVLEVVNSGHMQSVSVALLSKNNVEILDKRGRNIAMQSPVREISFVHRAMQPWCEILVGLTLLSSLEKTIAARSAAGSSSGERLQTISRADVFVFFISAQYPRD